MSKTVLQFIGDVMLGDQYLSLGFGVRGRYNKAYSDLIGDEELWHVLQQPDLLIANLECAYNNDPKLTIAENVITTNSEGLDFVKRLGVKVVTLANNHTLENGESALEQLKQQLTARGIDYCGTADRPCCIKEVRGEKVAILSCTLIPDHKNTPAIMGYDAHFKQLVQQASQTADIVVVCPHWGNEFVHIPSPEQIMVKNELLQLGATVIAGCHQHVLQPVEELGSQIVLHGLGNFVFDSYSPQTSLTAVFEVAVERTNDTVKCNYKPYPVQIGGNYILRLAPQKMNEALSILSKPVDDNIDLASYNAKVMSARSVYRKQTITHILSNVFRYTDKVGMFKWIAKRGVLFVKNFSKEKNDPSDVYRWN